MFDVLTYQKGAATLRMLDRYLGGDEFRDGIRLYLQRHAYGNTETHDLWNALEEASGEPVRRIMDQWIWQGGYPLLTVSPDDEGVPIAAAPVPWPMEPTTSPPGTCRCGARARRRGRSVLVPAGGVSSPAAPTPPWWRTPARAASSACATTGISWMPTDRTPVRGVAPRTGTGWSTTTGPP
jgi:hypothetical protein